MDSLVQRKEVERKLVYIGDELRMYRLEKGLSPEEFAEMFFISKNYLDKLESKSIKTRKPVTSTLAILICSKFNDWTLFASWENELKRVLEAEKEKAKYAGGCVYGRGIEVVAGVR